MLQGEGTGFDDPRQLNDHVALGALESPTVARLNVWLQDEPREVSNSATGMIFFDLKAAEMGDTEKEHDDTS